MVIIQEYYLERGKIKSHPCYEGENFNKCYEVMVGMHKEFPGMCILYPCIPKKYRKDFIKSIFEDEKFKKKSILTIINID